MIQLAARPRSCFDPTGLPDPNVLLSPDSIQLDTSGTAVGNAVLLENVEEVLDPSLEPVLLKQAHAVKDWLCPTTMGHYQFDVVQDQLYPWTSLINLPFELPC